jgi:uncharacterized protein YdeI (YjbR/CyaY-like superfamily)
MNNPSMKQVKNITEALRRNSEARTRFERLPPSHRREYVAWIDSAKKEETRQRRIEQAIAMLLADRPAGLK